MLAQFEQLERKVGKRPNHSWREEWPALIREMFGLHGYGRDGVPPEEEALGPEHSIEAMTSALAQLISWLEEAGWPRAWAVPCTLLGFCGRSALRRALVEGDSIYAASTFLLNDCLLTRASLVTVPAPLAFRNLTGNGGLVADDPAWKELIHLDSTPAGQRVHFQSGCLCLADTNPANFSSDEGFAVLTWTPLPGGGCSMEYVLQDSDVVCFTSSAQDERGYHSLVPSGGTSFVMPAQARVVLESVSPPGEWYVGGKAIKRKCFTVSFTYL